MGVGLKENYYCYILCNIYCVSTGSYQIHTIWTNIGSNHPFNEPHEACILSIFITIILGPTCALDDCPEPCRLDIGTVILNPVHVARRNLEHVTLTQ